MKMNEKEIQQPDAKPIKEDKPVGYGIFYPDGTIYDFFVEREDADKHCREYEVKPVFTHPLHSK